MPKQNTICLKKFFTWEIEDFDPEKLKRFVDFDCEDVPLFGPYGYLRFPVIRTLDRYNVIERVAKLKIMLWQKADFSDAVFLVNITPPVISKTATFFSMIMRKLSRYPILDGNNFISGKYSKVLFCVDVVVLLFPKLSYSTWYKVKNMFKKDPANKFMIKCHDETIETLNPILIACFPVFESMGESDMIEARETCMEITDFESQVVKKMVEFCETDRISSFDGCEVELFKIAHKYQMEELMDYAYRQMIRTANDENRLKRHYFLAHMLNPEDFKKRCAFL